MKTPFFFLPLIVAALFAPVWPVGQAALPTLLLAPGARATGLGEAYVALTDDVYATFYNPGAMGLNPLANNWKTYPIADSSKLVALTAKSKLFFAEKPAIWVASESGIYKYDGANWLDYEIFYLEQNDNIEKVVKRYLNLGDSQSELDQLKAAVDTVRKINNIKSKEDEEDLPDFKMPFSIAVRNVRITVLAADPGNKLWVGTDKGLMFYNGTKWKTYNSLDGLPDDRIRAVNADEEVWVGTDKGAARLSGGKWRPLSTLEAVGSDTITCISLGGATVWLGTTNGLIRKKGKNLTVFDSTNGLLDNRVVGIAEDKDRNVWVATKSGVSRYKFKSWKKYRLDENETYSINVDSRDFIWVGTRKGALRYDKGVTKIKQGKEVLKGAGWKHFHSKNGLPSDQVIRIISQEKDVWFLTDKGVCRYDKAEREIGAFWENLLPEFGLKDLYHLYFSTTWPTEDWGTLGGFVKYVSFGENEWRDEVGRFLGTFRSFDMFIGLCYGTNFGDNIGVGITPKFIYSKLADVPVGNEKRRGIAYSLAVDFGYKHRNIVKSLDFGLALQNMGPDIVYIDQNQKDPIPFNLRTGVAWRAIDDPIHNLKFLFDINKELVRRRDDDETVRENGSPLPHDPFWKAVVTSWLDDSPGEELAEIVYSLGTEYWYSNFIAFRAGTMYDKAGSRGEITFGLGLNYGNIHFDGSYIVGSSFVDKYLLGDILPGPVFADEGSARNKQLRLSTIFMF